VQYEIGKEYTIGCRVGIFDGKFFKLKPLSGTTISETIEMPRSSECSSSLEVKGHLDDMSGGVSLMATSSSGAVSMVDRCTTG